MQKIPTTIYSKQYTLIDPILYTYCKIDSYTIDGLLNNYLWFSKPKDFNDPYDCYPYHEISLSKVDIQNYRNSCLNWLEANNEIANFDKNPRKYIKKSLDKVLNNIGIKCFSEVDNEMLMWAHYADAHKGMCLEFDCNFDKTFFNGNQNLENALYKIEYCDDIPKFEFIQPNKFGNDLEIRRFQHAIDLKSSKWAYEKEIRLVKNLEFKEHYLKSQPQIIQYNKECLKSIKFGTKTNQRDIEIVKERVLKIIGYEANLKFYKAKIAHPKTGKYGIIFDEI